MYDIDLTPDFLDHDLDHDHDFNHALNTPRPNITNISSIDITKSMTKKELAEKLGVSPRTLRRWLQLIGDKEIPGYKKKRLITPAILKILSEKLCF